jgi:hypothetical protein
MDASYAYYFFVDRPQRRPRFDRPCTPWPTSYDVGAAACLARQHRGCRTGSSSSSSSSSIYYFTTTVLVFVAGFIPFAVATVELWRRVALQLPFGTGGNNKDHSVLIVIGDDNDRQLSRGRRVLGKGRAACGDRPVRTGGIGDCNCPEPTSRISPLFKCRKVRAKGERDEWTQCKVESVVKARRIDACTKAAGDDLRRPNLGVQYQP